MLLKLKSVNDDFKNRNLIGVVERYSNVANKMIDVLNGRYILGDEVFYELFSYFYTFDWNEDNIVYACKKILNDEKIIKSVVKIHYSINQMNSRIYKMSLKEIYSRKDYKFALANFLELTDDIISKHVVYVGDYDNLDTAISKKYFDYKLTNMTLENFLYKEEFRDIIESELKSRIKNDLLSLFEDLREKMQKYEKEKALFSQLPMNECNWEYYEDLKYKNIDSTYDKEINKAKELVLLKTRSDK